MSLDEIKHEIDAMTESGRVELVKYLKIKQDAVNPELATEMEHRLARVRSGKYYTEEDLQRIRMGRVAEEP